MANRISSTFAIQPAAANFITELVAILKAVDIAAMSVAPQHSQHFGDSISDLILHISLLPRLLPGRAILKADSFDIGAFTIERNFQRNYRVWVRSATCTSEFGIGGWVMEIGGDPKTCWVSKDALQALETIKAILTNSDVTIRGSSTSPILKAIS